MTVSQELQAMKEEEGRWAVSFRTMMDDFVALKLEKDQEMSEASKQVKQLSKLRNDLKYKDEKLKQTITEL